MMKLLIAGLVLFSAMGTAQADNFWATCMVHMKSLMPGEAEWQQYKPLIGPRCTCISANASEDYKEFVRWAMEMEAEKKKHGDRQMTQAELERFVVLGASADKESKRLGDLCDAIQ